MPTAAELLEALDTGFPNTVQQRVRTYNLRDSYKSVSWVYACVNLIADSIAGVEFYFYRKDGLGNPQRLEDRSEPVVYCFYPPRYGEIFTISEMIKMQYLHLGLFGESFLLLEKKGKVPVEIDIINPLNITPNISKDGKNITSWRIKQQLPGGTTEEKTVPTTDIVQWKYPNPYSKFRGMAPLTAARLAIEQDLNMATWNAGFFQNGIRNPIALLLKQTFNDPQRKEYMKRLRENFMGFVKGQLPLLVEGGVDVQVLSNTMKDLDFVQGKELTREELAAVYGTPPALVGIYRYANYSNVKEQTKIFYDTALRPKMTYYRDLFQQSILNPYFPGVICDWEWDSVEAFKEDPEISAAVENTTANTVNIYWNMGMTLPQIAYILRRPDLNPDNQVTATPPNPEVPEPEVPKDYRPRFSHSKSHLVVYASRGFYRNYADETMNGVLRTQTQRLSTFVSSFVEQARKSAGRKTGPTERFWAEQWSKGIEPILTETLRLGRASAYTDLKKDPGESTLALDSMARAIVEMGSNLVKAMATKKSAKEAIALVPLLNGKAPISKTLHRLYNQGRFEGLKELGVDEVVWCSNDHHAHHNGMTFKLGAEPSSLDATYPGETGEVCTCTLFPATVRKPEERVRIGT